ncbi:hypothetical protein [Nocardia sp. XZ_19_369]|uniref:hypothetical protein n=1 Tax=Nocardia sp. XZ_19_369 TaxID=2769487 RepID=UPI00188FAFC0|nr:hypothetical protein [Nocardia sp. XZ_19_369]
MPTTYQQHGWCQRCGNPYADLLQPSCECAGEPPIGYYDNPLDTAFRTHVDRVLALRYNPTPNPAPDPPTTYSVGQTISVHGYIWRVHRLFTTTDDNNPALTLTDPDNPDNHTTIEVSKLSQILTPTADPKPSTPRQLITRAQAEHRAGRPLTDHEIDQIDTAITTTINNLPNT